MTVAKAVNRATAHAAGLFLDKVIAEMPLPAQAIQAPSRRDTAASQALIPDTGLSQCRNRVRR